MGHAPPSQRELRGSVIEAQFLCDTMCAVIWTISLQGIILFLLHIRENESKMFLFSSVRCWVNWTITYPSWWDLWIFVGMCFNLKPKLIGLESLPSNPTDLTSGLSLSLLPSPSLPKFLPACTDGKPIRVLTWYFALIVLRTAIVLQSFPYLSMWKGQ